MNEISTLLDKLYYNPATVQFGEVLDVIETNYHFRPTAFTNGDLENEEDQNNGSCKLFAFALMHKLTKEATLQLFGSYYRVDVLESPEGADHQNIRNFMKFGWEHLVFNGTPLRLR